MSDAAPGTVRVTAALLVIGDEILSGRTSEANLRPLARFLCASGVNLDEVRMVGDRPDLIVAAIRQLRSAYDYMFTTGGIGPTHDDVTIQCVADALNAPLAPSAEVLAVINRQAFGRLTCVGHEAANLPFGARLISDPRDGPPGFMIANVFVLPGYPEAAAAMLGNVSALITQAGSILHRSVTLRLADESRIAGPLRELAMRHPTLSFGSYPMQAAGGFTCDIVLKGVDEALLGRAFDDLLQTVHALGLAADATVQAEGRDEGQARAR